MVARLTREQIEELRAIDSPTIANAIEYFNVRGRVQGYVGYDIRCLIPGLGPMVGYAVTCKGDSTTEGRQVERAHQKLYEAIAASPKPVVVVIQDDGNDRLHSCHAGEIMATTMKRCGAIGLVTDGGLRDILEVKALGGFHYYGAGLVVSHGNPLIYDVGAEVTISGVTIRPGDLLHGDENGITVIPEEIADKVAAQAMKVREMEQARLREILSPDFLKQFERLARYE
ncbi:MAG: RraA family protein [Chloroflexi bacterium]|jgi:4-hydroxy-4-methyl-2-oxoglutarate aldolase|nr:RraA family protein [Chloroflexota bacterium]